MRKEEKTVTLAELTRMALDAERSLSAALPPEGEEFADTTALDRKVLGHFGGRWKKVVLIAAVVTLCCLVVAAGGGKLINMLVFQSPYGVTIRVETEGKPLEKLPEGYGLQEIPGGYTEEMRKMYQPSGTRECVRLRSESDGTYFCLEIMVAFDSAEYELGGEDDLVEYVDIHGAEAWLITAKSGTAEENYTVLWAAEGMMHMIWGNAPRDIILRAAEAVG